MYDVVELMVSYKSADAPLTREAVRTSCVTLFATRALVRFADAGAETKTHSNTDCLVVIIIIIFFCVRQRKASKLEIIKYWRNYNDCGGLLDIVGIKRIG